MNLDDLKDRFKSEGKALADRVQESSAYNNLKDRFDSASPGGQKAILIAASCLLVLAILYIPWGYYSSSALSVEEFEDRRQLIHDMMHVTRETSDTPELPVPPSLDAIRSSVEQFIKSAGLIDKQKGTIGVVTEPSTLVPAGLNQGILSVQLKMLNLTQLMDIGYQIQSISSSIKLKDLIVEPSSENPKYLDVIYKLIVLKVPAILSPAPAEESKGKKQNTGSAKAEDKEQNAED